MGHHQEEVDATAPDMEPDWVVAREAVDELIADIGVISDDARAWAREALGVDEEGS